MFFVEDDNDEEEDEKPDTKGLDGSVMTPLGLRLVEDPSE
jgi:hypothetical protein